VSAELPDPATHQRLYNIVTKQMLRGPCGQLDPGCGCMKDNICSKGYPKAFQEVTIQGDHAYPVYRRRNNGQVFQGRRKLSTGRWVNHTFDNRDVVPYNARLTEKYDCHINVEVCSNISAIKYLYKYLYKGGDMADMHAVPVAGDGAPPPGVNEIDLYVGGRYVSAIEPAWRLFGFKLQARSPAVCRLHLHEPNQQQVYIRNGNVQQALANSRTTLTAWLEYNRQKTEAYQRELAVNPEAAPPACLAVLYSDFADTHTFHKPQKAWRPRVGPARPPVWRIHEALYRERMYLRFLLNHTPGATSFDYLYTTGHGTPEEVLWPTFRDACRARNLLQDDEEWEEILQHATTYAPAGQMRRLFANIICNNEVNDPRGLWDQFLPHFIDDFLPRAQAKDPAQPVDRRIIDLALHDLNKYLLQLQQNLRNIGLPIPAPLPEGPEPCVLQEERGQYDHAVEAHEGLQNFNMLNADQRAIFLEVMAAVDGDQQGRTAFFVDGVGGAGKTFMYNTLLQVVRGTECIALAVASSGIAALLLNGGRTALSRFKVPVKGLCETSTCAIPGHGELTTLLRHTALIV
jgi:hypothetical protein